MVNQYECSKIFGKKKEDIYKLHLYIFLDGWDAVRERCSYKDSSSIIKLAIYSQQYFEVGKLPFLQ